MVFLKAIQKREGLTPCCQTPNSQGWITPYVGTGRHVMGHLKTQQLMGVEL